VSRVLDMSYKGQSGHTDVPRLSAQGWGVRRAAPTLASPLGHIQHPARPFREALKIRIWTANEHAGKLARSIFLRPEGPSKWPESP